MWYAFNLHAVFFIQADQMFTIFVKQFSQTDFAIQATLNYPHSLILYFYCLVFYSLWDISGIKRNSGKQTWPFHKLTYFEPPVFFRVSETPSIFLSGLSVRPGISSPHYYRTSTALNSRNEVKGLKASLFLFSSKSQTIAQYPYFNIDHIKLILLVVSYALNLTVNV